MSGTEDLGRRSVEDVREIERATERLERTLQRAREAVQRATRADSMSTTGTENTAPEPDAHDEDQYEGRHEDRHESSEGDAR